ncbi:serine/threonine protein phosphatase (plasmid) [Rhizobium bangladeshense]|uniref:metallophosphoesterase family protein n=1 Tax=Rhizobium bangladeshense TaxID=1138189 RepID=UPI001A99BA38|nr:metallophosphoesterase family protein [Rhizobium bangladeshense]QSY98578.1 serine/threonine protein phosphatase [Rhizobium bangladeshense]
MKYTYCLSDIHGMIDHLIKAMRWIANDVAETGADMSDVTIVFMGDYIDRGPASRAVLDTLMVMKDVSPPTVIILRGNHEDLMLQALRYRSKTHEECWLANGGLETLKNYEKKTVRGLYDDAIYEHLDFIESMDLWYEDEQRIYVHAGILGDTPGIGDHRAYLWARPADMRMWFENGRPFPEKLVVHGHTPFHPGYPGKTICIDGGACFDKGHLKVVKFCDEHRDPINIAEIAQVRPTGMNDNKVQAA